MIAQHFKATTLKLIIQFINFGIGIYFCKIIFDFLDFLDEKNVLSIPVELAIPIVFIVTLMLFASKPKHRVRYIDFNPELDNEYMENFIRIHIQLLALFIFVAIVMFVEDSFILYERTLAGYKLFSFILILVAKFYVYGKNYDLLYKILLSPKVKIKTSYYDYINKNIVDDEPHLELNQLFTFQVKEHFRNSKEEKEITILNPKTPNKPAKVMMLESKYLANYLRHGGDLKAKLLEILPNTELIIEIKREKYYYK